jgi:Undecaprenyl-phosphate galactose phosphotransferase WbaP
MNVSSTLTVSAPPSRASRAERRRNPVNHARWFVSRSLTNSSLLAAADSGALVLALGCAALVRRTLVGTPVMVPAWALLVLPAWWLGALLAGLLPGWGLSAVEHLRRQVVLITTLFGFGAVLIFFTKSADAISRLEIGAAWIFAMVFIPWGRSLMRAALCARRTYGVPTILFGSKGAVAEVASRLRIDPGFGYFPVGVFTDDPATEIAGLPVRGNLSHISALAPAAIIASGGMSGAVNRAVIERVVSVYRNVTILPDLGDIPSSFVMPRDLTGAVGLEISQELWSPFATKIKRVLDLFLVVGTALLWMPLVGVACFAIWAADGKNPLFRQERIGRGAQRFHALKCRTMVPDAEAVLQRHFAAHPEIRAEWEKDFKLRADPRITRLGGFLRRTSLDELPQLFNVLNGDMALVGPRPLPAYHLERMSSAVRTLRERMRPGLTGLWQVSGRSDTGTEGMTRWDHYYVRNWSLWLDVVIVVRTARAVIQGSGAR